MNNQTIRTLSIIVIALQSLAVLTAFGIISMQDRLISVFYHFIDVDRKIWPASFAFMVISLIIYVIFFSMSQSKVTSDKKTLAIIFIILSIILGITSVGAQFFMNIYYSRLGAELVAKHSVVNSLITVPLTLFAGPAAPLFYFTCGKYSSIEIPETPHAEVQQDNNNY